uniref:Uncharacterized protein n=1 Tax=Timema bartmani TaxID=61472 RepID=A0A7R9I076_9NEOP|nr:unnamed protein product [Timema bartmani]
MWWRLEGEIPGLEWGTHATGGWSIIAVFYIPSRSMLDYKFLRAWGLKQTLVNQQHLFRSNFTLTVKVKSDGGDGCLGLKPLASLSASLKPILWDGGWEGERCGVASQPTKVSFRANKNRWIMEIVDSASYRTASPSSSGGRGNVRCQQDQTFHSEEHQCAGECRAVLMER